jgi:hypothetical protein
MLGNKPVYAASRMSQLRKSREAGAGEQQDRGDQRRPRRQAQGWKVLTF